MIKKIATFAIAFAAVFNMLIIPCSATGVNYNGRIIPLGDAVGDSTVDIRDLIRIKKYLSGCKTEISSAADINDDGEVTSEDMVLLKKSLISINVSPEESALWSKMYY